MGESSDWDGVTTDLIRRDGVVGYGFVEMVSDDGRPNGYRHAVDPVSDPSLVTDRHMDWTCDADTDDDPLEVVVDLRVLAELQAKAREYDRLLAVCVHMPRCVCE